jgi:hypothetical protein
MELHKQEAQVRFNRLEAKAEMDKRDAKAEMDKRDARCDKLEMKAEMDKRDARCDKLEMTVEMDKRDAKAEMDKRDAQARCDKLEAKAEIDKRDAKAEMDKRDARCDKLEIQAEMIKDMLQQQQQQQHQQHQQQHQQHQQQHQQIAQLKWEARPAPTPQVVYNSPPAVSPPPPLSTPQVAPPSYIPQQNHPSSVNPAVLLASPPLQYAQKNMHKMGELKEAAVEKPSSQIARTILPPSPADGPVSDAAVVVTPAAKSVAISSQHQKPSLPMLKHPPSQQQPSFPPSHSNNAPAPIRLVPQQSHHSNSKVPAGVGVGAVALPGDAQSHFFLSHAQSTGGDQTNAIYLELQQLGFTCWYVTSLCIDWYLLSMW